MNKLLFALTVLLFVATTAGAMGTAPKPPAVADLQTAVQNELNRMNGVMKLAAIKLAATDLKGLNARQALYDVYSDVNSAIVVSSISLDGTLLAVEPSARYSSGVGQSITNQALFQTLRSTNKPAMGQMFLAVEGFNAVALGYPIVSQPDGKTIGYTTLVFQPDALIRKIVNDQAGGVTFEALAIQLDGKVIFDRDILQVGKMTFSDPGYAQFPSLVAFAQQVVATPEGSGHYEFLDRDRATTVHKQATWATVGLYGTQWRLIVSAVQ
ncbi:MAG: hypothetical protein WC529_06365 [Candidatus Margulisiibacteriota bacterium]